MSKRDNKYREPIKYLEQDETLPKCFLVDCDGCITTGPYQRSAFDWTKVSQDKPNKYLIDILNLFIKADVHIRLIFLSGRDEVCRDDTVAWLHEHVGFYDELFMRPKGDNRPDVDIKREIYEREILGKYYVMSVFDDRKQMKKFWFEQGLHLLAVGDPESDF